MAIVPPTMRVCGLTPQNGTTGKKNKMHLKIFLSSSDHKKNSSCESTSSRFQQFKVRRGFNQLKCNGSTLPVVLKTRKNSKLISKTAIFQNSKTFQPIAM